MAVLLQDSFQNNPDGLPGNADSGQPWVLTGPDQLNVFTGFLMLLADGLNGYAQAAMTSTPDTAEWTLVFTDNTPGTQSTAAFILHDEPIFVGLDMGCHLVMTPGAFTYQVRENGGAFVDVYSHSFMSPLATFTPLDWSISIDGAEVTLTAPDASVHVFDDPRIEALIGPKLVIQTIRSNIAYGNSWWVDILLEGEPEEASTLNEYGPCDTWPVQWPCEISMESIAVTGAAVEFATEIVWALSGRQFGYCDVTLRPCRKTCSDAPWPDPEFSWPGRSWMRAALIQGRWYNITCGSSGCQGGDCSCTSLSQVYLPSVVSEVLQVKVDGVVLDPSAYRLDNGRILVRLDGEEWPRCNDLNLDDSQSDTWSVTARFGRAVPTGGAWAVGELACELIKSMSGEDCRLPERVTQIARQGVTITFPDASEFFDKGLTGLYMTDMFIKAWNPSGLRRRSRVYNVDDPWPRRTGA